MNDTARRAPSLRGRGLTSFVVVLSFVAMTVSGAVLYVAPRGRTANWSGWTWLGLWREQWVALHVVLSTLFVLFGLAHLVYNRRPLWSYLHSRLRRGVNLWKELVAAVVLVVGLSIASVAGLPPARQLVRGGEDLKDSWARTLPEAPIPHAELLTLEDLGQRTSLPAEALAKVLRESGLSVGGAGLSLLQLAEDNDTTPAAIYELLRERHPEIERLSGRGRGRGGGYGRGT